MNTQICLSYVMLSLTALFCMPSWADFEYYTANMRGASCLPMTPATTGTRHNGRYTVTSDQGWVSCSITALEDGYLSGHRVQTIFIEYTAPASIADQYNPPPLIPGFPQHSPDRRPSYGCTAGGSAPAELQSRSWSILAEWYRTKSRRVSRDIVCHLPRGGAVLSVRAVIEGGY